MTTVIAEVAIAKVVDFAITAFIAGLEREPIVVKVREMELAGATPDEITDALQSMRKASEAEAQAKIDAA